MKPGRMGRHESATTDDAPYVCARGSVLEQYFPLIRTVLVSRMSPWCLTQDEGGLAQPLVERLPLAGSRSPLYGLQ